MALYIYLIFLYAIFMNEKKIYKYYIRLPVTVIIGISYKEC